MSGLAAIDCENHSAFHLEALQTIHLKENDPSLKGELAKQTLLHYYLRIILDQKNDLR
jgi:hypothetical protein